METEIITAHTFVTNFNADGQATADIELMTDERGHMYPFSQVFDGSTLGSSFEVTAKREPGRVVNITKGYLQIPFSDYAYLGWLEEDTDIRISANTDANPRYSAIVAYIYRGVQHDESVTNNPETLRITEVKGTPSASPAEVGEQTIRAHSEIGDNPYIVLAQIYVPAGATTIPTNNIIDKRTTISLREGVTLPYGSYATGLQKAAGSSSDGPLQIAVINAKGVVPPALTDTDLLVCRISQ